VATIIDGNELSRKKRLIIADEAAEFARRCGRPPGLAVVLVGGDPASAIYVRNKKKACETVGFRSFDHHLDGGTPREELLALVKKLNDDPAVDGILVQFPVPAHLDPQEIQLAIDPGKDVDGLHPYNLGRLLSGTPALVPCTPSGIMCMLSEYGVSLKGKDAVVIGRSNLVGKPVAVLLDGARDRHDLPFPHPRPAREGGLSGCGGGGHRQARVRQGRLDQGRRRGHRRGHEPDRCGAQGRRAVR